MARGHSMTPARRAALKKAQAASARKRRGRGKGKLAAANRRLDVHSRNRRRLKYAAGIGGAVALAAGAAHVGRKYKLETKFHAQGSGVKSGATNIPLGRGGQRFMQGRLGFRGRGIGLTVVSTPRRRR